MLVYDPFADIGSDDVEQVTELNGLLNQVHVVSLHARETAETRSILGAAQIARLRRGAVVVNCARGSLMDTTLSAKHYGQGFTAI
ncbi:NAD(P)-dependent oxidoreductase [Terriglobus sp. ADX1]|uniref:NAD(P)-dependent oxidoreductase n=1 Tax=Terriglobus sp. ADX1 TaxID=2794063 RepID=UPI002FE62586